MKKNCIYIYVKAPDVDRKMKILATIQKTSDFQTTAEFIFCLTRILHNISDNSWATPFAKAKFKTICIKAREKFFSACFLIVGARAVLRWRMLVKPRQINFTYVPRRQNFSSRCPRESIENRDKKKETRVDNFFYMHFFAEQNDGFENCINLN